MERLITGDYRTNTYIIIEGDGAILVDPGFEYERISALLKKHGCVPSYVIVTHGHFDHIGAVAQLRAAGAKVYMPEVDYMLVKECNFKFDLGFDMRDVRPFDIDYRVEPGDCFDLLGHHFESVFTPGHTPGSMCYIMDGKDMFTGDTLFRLSAGRTDLAGGNMRDLLISLKKLFSLDGDYNVYPGHSDATTLAYERVNNPYVELL